MAIHLLDPITINKIAAGEVIENPASVIKELVENSLDAGATEICVEIKGGGRQLIRVTDDGCGMDAADAALSLERHATSKLSSIEEMERIGTMGFRGEAIPSIASISKFSLLTCPKGADETSATLVRVEGGKTLTVSPAARDPGTTIEVGSLFFNIPVRKKFQRSPASDNHEILKTLSSLALANPDVKFEFIRDGEAVLSAKRPHSDAPLEKLEERIADILGPELISEACPLEKISGEIILRGFLGLPGYTRPNRTGQHLFLNKRAVQSPLISYAVRDGYGPALPTNRHPFYILHVQLPGSYVDVNVHPQKREVRLREEQYLRSLVCKAVEEALHDEGIASFSLPVPEMPFAFDQFKPEQNESAAPFFELKESGAVYDAISEAAAPPFREMPLFEPAPEKKSPKVLASIPGYILVEEEDRESCLSLIDQHAAHARVIYEKLQKQEIQTEQLLIPITLTLNPLEASYLNSHLEGLNALGICIREFGENTFAVDALPKIFGNIDAASLIADIVKGLQNQGGNAFEMEREKRLSLIASRTASRSSIKLSFREAEGLVKQLFSCEKPYLCPLGKPTVAKITAQELAKKFQ